MRIVVLGGGGYEGSAVSALLVNQIDVEKVLVADKSEQRATMAAQKLGTKAEVRIVDVNDHNGLVKVLKEAELVINMVGPFYLHGPKVLKAAVEAKRNYVDLCDDYDATRDFLALDGDAKEAGITAVINTGVSPGLSNVLAKYAASKLDQVDEILISWCLPYGVGEGVGAGLHAFHMLDGDVPQFLEGEAVNVPAGAGREVVEFPIGPIECFYVGHPEPVTLPLHIKGVRRVTCKGVITPSWVGNDMMRMAEYGFAAKEPVKIKRDVFVNMPEVALRAQANYIAKRELGRPQGGIKIEVRGMKDGNKVSYTYDLPTEKCSGLMSETTCPPVAATALLVSRGDFQTRGVSPPEMLDATQCLRLVAELGLECYQTETITRKVKT